MTSISSLPPFGPEAKNTAGSPGNTRISRNVKTSTPNSAGREDMKRLPARIIVATKLFMTAGGSLAAEVAIIDLTVKLVSVALDRGCHHGVLTRLPERNLRHLGEMDRVEFQAVLVVLGLVRLEARLLGGCRQFGIIDAAVIPALIAGIEIAVEIIGRGQPGDDAFGEERQLLLVDLRRHLRIRQFLYIDLDADLGERFLDQRRHRLGRRGLTDVEAKRRREAIRHAGGLQKFFCLVEIEL